MEVVDRMVNELGRTGRRGAGGFYEYPAQGRKHLWPGLRTSFPTRAMQPDVEEIKRRLLHIQALESSRCLEEGVLRRAADGDLGSVLGIGFPAWTGGALSWIETCGIGRFTQECRDLARRVGTRFEPTETLIAASRAAPERRVG
jgi:3-hydroxyacyl-CoA dehydrogenase / enoyl-CoA hydratase / 3-hydroxybutyryl-CoA epimerase